jgi:urease accessory protein
LEAIVKPAEPRSAVYSDQPGHAALEVSVVFGESTVTSAYATNPLKLLTPRPRGPSVWTYTSSFGGGLLAGDQTRLDLNLGAGAKCFVGTQASTKVYRNPGQLPCGHITHAMLATDSLLIFSPEPVQAFADSVYVQQQEFHLAPGAGLVLLDWFSSGRSARGERWEFAHFQTRNDVFIGGERVFVDSVLFDPSDGSLTSLHRGGRFNCFAMLLFMGAAVQDLAGRLISEISARPVESGASLVCSASPIRDGVLLRVAGAELEDVAREIHSHLHPLSGLLGDDPWQRRW